MRAAKFVTIMIAMLLSVSVNMAVEDSGSTGVLSETCSDLSDLNPEERQRMPLPYGCQVIDDNAPVPQSNEAASSSGMQALSWLSLLRFLLPMIRT